MLSMRLCWFTAASLTGLVGCGGAMSDYACSEDGTCEDGVEIYETESAVCTALKGDNASDTRTYAKFFDGCPLDEINSSTDVDWYYIRNDGVPHAASSLSATAPSGVTLRCAVYQNDGTTALASSSATGGTVCKVTFAASGTNYYYWRLSVLYNVYNTSASTFQLPASYTPHE